MKNLILITGTSCVGKTATSKKLVKLLPNCVFLDGDWCWYADPWTVTDETKRMAEKNMSFLLNSFLDCSAYENIIFSWILRNDSMVEMVLSWLKGKDYNLHKFSLICSDDALKSRYQKDIADNLREGGRLEGLLQGLHNYFIEMDTVKIDTSDITPEQAANIIYNHIYAKMMNNP